MKTIKKHQKFFGEKQQKKCQESISSILYYELTPLIHDVTCSKLKRYGEHIGEKKLSA